MAMGRTKADLLAWFRQGVSRRKAGSQGVADRVPVYAQISHHSARLFGMSSVDFFTDPEVFLRCELAADLLYGIDGPTIHYDVYNVESEALGAELLCGPRQIPVVDPHRPLLSAVDDYERLTPIEIGVSGRMPYVLEINARLMDMGMEPKVRFTGLFTLAANLLGFQQLLLATLSDPEGVHRLMHFLTHEVVAPWIVCQREHCRSDATATGSDALASPPLISTQTIREFCLRYILELEQLVGKIRLAGLWGESALQQPEELLEIKQAGSPGAIQVLDPDVTVLGPVFFRRYADRSGLALVVGLDANLIGSGPVAEIASRATRFIEESGCAGRFVLFVNDIPYDTPPRNVRAAVSVAREYRANASRTGYVREPSDATGREWPSREEAYRSAATLVGTM